MNRLVAAGAWAFLTVCFAACSPAPEETPARKPVPGAVRNVAGANVPQVLTIGDVNFHFFATVLLNPSTLPDTVAYHETHFDHFDSRVSSATATVSKPYPEVLDAVVTVASAADFPGDAILITTRIYVDDRVVDTYDLVFGENTRAETRVKNADIMEWLNEVPDSILVRIELDGTIYKETSSSDIDPATAPRPPDDSTTIYSNTLRINFAS